MGGEGISERGRALETGGKVLQRGEGSCLRGKGVKGRAKREGEKRSGGEGEEGVQIKDGG